MSAPVPLRLLPVTLAHKQALQQGPAALAALLGVTVPEGWPHFPQAFVPQRDGDEDAAARAWPSFLFLTDDTLVGNGGFKGAPNAAGEVEIGNCRATAQPRLGHRSRTPATGHRVRPPRRASRAGAHPGRGECVQRCVEEGRHGVRLRTATRGAGFNLALAAAARRVGG